MANQALKESVLTNLRSVTQSCKGGVPLDRLQRDYREILGSNIPFRELGFNSLETFIRSIPNVISLRRNHEGQLMAEGVADATTAHIVSLVSKQKSSDNRKRGFRKPPSYFGMRKTLSSRYTFRESSRSTHTNYNSSASNYSGRSVKPRPVSPKHVPPRQAPSKPLMPNPVASQPPSASYNSKPLKSNDQVPSRKYEVAPRFKRLQNQNSNPSPPPVEERVPSPAPIVQLPVRNASHFSNSNNWEVIPPPMIPPPQPSSRPLPSRPRHIENTRYTQLNSLESTKSAKEYVAVYANMNDIELSYTTSPLGQKAKNKGHVSTLCLGEKKYHSYPDIKLTREEAEEVVAKKATEDIKKMMQEQMNSLPETPYGTTEEIKQLLVRIEEIVCEKPSGMFENGVVQEYETTFNERLPVCWPDLLRQSGSVEIDAIALANGRVPKGANFIVRPSKELSSGNRTPSSTSSKTEFTYEGLDAGALQNNLVDISYPEVPNFVLPTGNVWDVYVSNVGNGISVRIIDYDDDLLDLSNKMAEFYNMRSLPVTEVIEYEIYAACVDDKPDIWHRVLIDELKEDELLCYFLDEGYFSYIKKENLQEICPSFLRLPFQAIPISLDGLDEYGNYPKYVELYQSLFGQSLVAEVKRMYEIPDFFPGIPGIHRTAYSVTLYDTSYSSQDLNLNRWLEKSVKASLVCKLPKPQTLSCAYLSHVTSDGRVYLRFTNPEQCWIEEELQKLCPVFDDAAASNFEISPIDTMCVAKYESGTWHRATISGNQLASSEPDMVEVFFVDYGHSCAVGRSEICQLTPINAVLASISYQAVCCELVNAFPSPGFRWTKTASTKLLELAPYNQELIISVMNEEDEQSLAKVNLFKRNQESDLVSINTTLFHNISEFQHPAAAVSANVPTQLPLQPWRTALQNTLSSAIPDVAVPAEQMAQRLVASMSSEELQWLNTPDDIRSPGAFNVQSPVSLDIAPVPVGELFNVYVTMAATPCNFVVQPLVSSNDLEKLRLDMQNFYSADENQLEMDVSMLRKNDFYAALHSDGTWYRVKIAEIMATNPVMVAAHYVDYGDFDQLNISNLQPLYQKFQALPCQAIKASLSGIRPYESDWDPVHCVEFRTMVTEKPFVSHVKNKTVPTNDIPAQSVELILIDTSTEDDILIHELLIDRRIAKRCEGQS